MDLLRFSTAGSVDDGKSTLIGRLLFDSKGIFEDQLAAIERTSRRRGYNQVDLALLTDGLRAEREQGITIDVAYRYFATPRRKFIIADTPGHVQYTRNMVTGASTADLAIVLVDARKGVLEQSHRHAFIAALLGIPHLVVAVNKMDLVGYDEERLRRGSRTSSRHWAAKLDVHDIQFIPISALHGDNVVTRSLAMPWYQGPSLLYHLEHVYIGVRPQPDRRPLPGPVGHPPADRRAPRLPRLRRPDRGGRLQARATRWWCCRPASAPASSASRPSTGSSSTAAPPLSVSMLLEDDIDVSRGDMICRPHNQPTVDQRVRGDDLLDGGRAAPPGRRGTPSSTPRATRKAMVEDLRYRIDVNTLHRDEAPPSSGSTRSAGSGCAPASRCCSTSTG